MKKVIFFLPLMVFFLIAGFLLKGLELDPSAMPSALLDKPMPAFVLSTLESSEEIGVADLPDETFLLNVWATWCVSCRIEHPYLVSLAEEGVAIVGLNYKDDDEKARGWLQQLGNPYRFNLRDVKGRLGLDLGVFGAPETFVVDRDGVIRYKHVGVIDDRVWQETLRPIYEQLQAAR